MTRQEFIVERIKKDQQKSLENYRRLNPLCRRGETVFTGSSLMEYFPLNELAQSMGLNCCVYNRGVAGFETCQMLEHMHEQILDLAPARLYINIGTNDIGHGHGDVLMRNYREIIGIVKKQLPECRIYVMAFYPCNDLDDFGMSEEVHDRFFRFRTPQTLLDANAELKKMAEELGCRYIDVNDGLYDSRGRMKKQYCQDGVHMHPDGYAVVMKNLIPYLEEK